MDLARHDVYKKLKRDEGEFRILILEPGMDGDPVRCSLSTELLTGSHHRPYETISYHWGGRSARSRVVHPLVNLGSRLPERRCVEIAGVECHVPATAAQALECMRLPDKARSLWIDSICIDQGDLREREQQLALMGDIYKKGTQNLVYLDTGDAKEATAGVNALRKAFQRLQDELRALPEDVQEDWRKHRIKPNGWGKLEMPPVLVQDPPLIKTMFNCAWFTRLWVVQEACLARENVCHWAKERFDLQDLMDVVHISRELEVASDNEVAEVYRTYCCIQQLRYPLLIRRQFQRGEIENAKEAMTILFDSVRQCDVSHGHDRIFAVAGLLRSLPGMSLEATKLFEADYSKPLAFVFRDATRATLLSSGTDELLVKLSHRSVSELNDEKKPSWCFYWDRPSDLIHEAGRPTLFTTFHAGVSRASIHDPAPMLTGGAGFEPHILSLQGFLLGPIQDLKPHTKSGTLFQNPAAIDDLIESILDFSKAEPQPHWPEQLAINARIGGQAEALRMREIERANEVIRRRLSRNIGNMEIEAYSDLMMSRANSFSQLEESPGDQDKASASVADRVEITTITVLTAGWWEAQFGNPSVALRAFRALRNQLKQQKRPPDVLSEAFNMYMVIAASSNNRCFFTTHHGEVGCGPKIMEAEDIVAVFLGAKYPYVLRRSSPFDETYRLVGMAIIPGIMHGEIFRRDLEQQTFRLL